MECFLVEWYRPVRDDDQLSLLVAAVSDASAPVRCVLMLGVPTDDVVFGVFEADSADAVARMCRRAGMPASRLTAAVADRAAGPQA